MQYQNYRIAAERHIEASLQLLSLLEDLQSKEQASQLSIRQVNDKDKLLGELYYLTGYIIECSYFCAIFKHINWTSDVKQLKANNNTRQISFRSASPVFTMIRPGIKGHLLSGNMHFFQTVDYLTAVSGIPLIGYHPTGRLCEDLFDNWCAEIRYEIDPALALNYDTAFDFFFLSIEVYEGLLKNSMI